MTSFSPPRAAWFGCRVSKTGRNARWWKEEGEAAITALFALTDYIKTSGNWRSLADKFHARMYAGARAMVDDCSASGEWDYEYESNHLARNIARAATDTYVAKVYKHRPLPEILANQGNWRDQRRAKKMTQLVDGEFDRNKVFKRHARAIGRDSGVYGRGLLKVDLENVDSKNIRCERVEPEEVWVDEQDARYGAPRNLYHITTADLGVIQETFAEDDEELAERIEQASRATYNKQDLTITTTDRLDVVEGWHLCDNDEAHAENPPRKHKCKGRHLVAVRGVPLVDEEWPFPRFPFAINNYLEPLKGFWGVGLCEQLEGYAYEQNLMSEKVSGSHYMIGGAIIALPHGSDLVEEDITNGNVRILRHTPGLGPTISNPEPVHPATYQYLRDIGPDALNEVGMSEAAASASKAPGLTAAVAINAVDDIQSERLGMQGYGYAQWCVDVAELFLMWIQHIAKKHGDYTARVPLKGGIIELSWKDVTVDSYIVTAQNSALLQQTPAAKKQLAQEMFNSGAWDPQTFMRFLDNPDIQAEFDTETADRLQVDENIFAMLDAEDPEDPNAYKAPSPYTTDLQWAMKRAQLRLAQAESSGCEEANMQLVRDYILDIQDMLKPPPAPLPGPADMGAMLPPPGAPMAPPIPPSPVPGQAPPMAA